MPKHLIAANHFEPGHRAAQNDAVPTTCECGFTGTHAAFQAHRKEHGETTSSGHGYSRSGEPSVYTIRRKR